METIRLTTAQAIVRWVLAQRTVLAGEEVSLFAGAFGIFGHGNVTCLAEALQPVQEELPTWRGQNEQAMALAAVAYAKAMRGRRLRTVNRAPPSMVSMSTTGSAVSSVIVA